MRTLCVLSVVALGTTALCQVASRSVRDGVYTGGQAKRGQQLYSSSCASCHGDQLDGIEGAPALAGSDFLTTWSGRTVDVLFSRIQKTMPADNPGSLNSKQVADIVAYMLAQNSMPAGDHDLSDDPEQLKGLIMRAPGGK